MSSDKGTWHRVRQGECIDSIACDAGLFPDTIWHDPENAELKRRRSDPNVLQPGDRLFIREKKIRWENASTEACHRFRRKGVPAQFRLQLFWNDKPRADVPYTLNIEGVRQEGVTDADGWVEASISPDAKKAILTLHEDDVDEDEQDVYEIRLGHLNPKDDIAGIQQRLGNLGFYDGEPDGTVDAETEQALRFYQEANELTVTGKVDQATIDALASEHHG